MSLLRTRSMIRGVVAVAAAASLALITGCSAAPANDDRPLVVVTTNILGDVVSQLLGDQAQVLTLMPPDADPHSFEISAAEAARIQTADLLVENGLGLEEGLEQHVDAARSEGISVVSAGDLIEPIAYSQGDAEGVVDPHFWTDPRRMIDVVDGLQPSLVDLPGMDAAALLQSIAAYRTQLESLDDELEANFARLPVASRALVTNHHVFGYLAERYGFRVIGAVLPSGTTLAAPSASDLRELVSAIEDSGVRTIFADSSQPDRLIQVLADESDLEVDVVALYTESLTAPGGGAASYLEMMRANAQLIATGLSP